MPLCSPPPEPPERDALRVLILATGEAAARMSACVEEAGFAAERCADLPALRREIQRGAGAVIAAAEALRAGDVHGLLDDLAVAPAWSDLPLLVPAARDEAERRLVAAIAARANLVVLARPLRRAALAAAVRSALRARRRQYRARDEIRRCERAERALRRSEVHHRHAFENAGVGLGQVGLDLRWMDVNPRLCAVVGYDREELIGTSFVDITHPDDVEADVAEARRLARGEIERYALEKRYVRKDGHIVWVNLTVALQHDEAGQPAHYLVVVQDITDRKRAETALRESEERFRTFMNNSPFIAWAKDEEGRHVYLNRVYEDRFGVRLDDWRGKTDVELWPPDVARTFRDNDLAVLASGNTVEVVEEATDREGVRREWWNFKFSFADASGRRYVGGVGLDVTERRRMEEALRAAKAAAEEANRAKDLFLAVLGHELRTPLMPALVNVGWLLRRPALDPAVRERLAIVERNIALEARLVDDLLDVTRIARGKIDLSRQILPLCEVIRRAVEVCRPELDGKGVHFGVDLGPGAPYPIEADPVRLEQVFWNLLRNAIKFTPPGGCVGVRCRLDGRGCVAAEVVDSGVGIPKETLPRLFGPFEQAERDITRRFGGLGLGLAICKAFVELHGGTIEAHSDGPDRGACFRVILPLSGAEARPPALGAPSATP
jgi:two-component system CheB/CheR fusion protein